jgi:DNA-binding transcriptional LysR family regulator
VAEPRYLGACTRATTVFAILTGLFCSQAGAGVFSAGAGKSTDIGSRGDADATTAACTKLIYETPLGAIRRYRDRFPGIVLTVTEMAQEEMERAVSADALDVGLAFTDILAQDVEWLPLHKERLSLIVGREHPAAPGDREMDTTALAAESLALLGPTFATRVTVDRYLRRHGVQPHVAVETNSIAAIVEIVRVAGLATILPEAVAQEQGA